MCAVLLPPGVNPFPVKYIISYIISYNIVSHNFGTLQQEGEKNIYFPRACLFDSVHLAILEKLS